MSCGFCSGRNDTGAGFLRIFWFPLSTLICYHPGLVTGPTSGQRNKCTQSYPALRRRINAVLRNNRCSLSRLITWTHKFTLWARFGVFLILNHIVMCTPIARLRLGKYIPAQANSLNNRTSIARQGISKHTSLTINVFCVVRAKRLQRSVRQYRRVVEKWRVEFRDASLLGYELGSRGIELSRVFGIDSCRIMARKKLGGEKKTSWVISSCSETVINPLSGYD
jgi:hypothetical protein